AQRAGDRPAGAVLRPPRHRPRHPRRRAGDPARGRLRIDRPGHVAQVRGGLLADHHAGDGRRAGQGLRGRGLGAVAMSEPPESAARAEQVAPGVWHWSVNNSNIGGNLSASHAVATAAGSVWIDPVRLDDHDSLPAPEAIVLTSRGHQRSAWHYREQLGVQVWAPQGGEGYEQEPDVLYGEHDELPGDLRHL